MIVGLAAPIKLVVFTVSIGRKSAQFAELYPILTFRSRFPRYFSSVLSYTSSGQVGGRIAAKGNAVNILMTAASGIGAK